MLRNAGISGYERIDLLSGTGRPGDRGSPLLVSCQEGKSWIPALAGMTGGHRHDGEADRGGTDPGC
jgi:hypothetical protein